MPATRARTGLVIAVLGAMACREVPPTQLVVWIYTDFPDEAWDEVHVRVDGPDGPAYDGRIHDLPASFGVRPRHGDADRMVTASATIERDARPLLETAAATRFLRRRSLRLDLFLAASCLNVDCAPDQTCRMGECEDLVIDPDELPSGDLDPDLPDAGLLDASAAPDASADAGDGCTLCDPLANDGCPEATTCRDGPICTTCQVPGARPEGDSCDEDADCAASLGCLQIAGGGTCRAYCRGTDDCAAGACSTLYPDGVGLCTGTCDPIRQDCPAGTSCNYVTVDPTTALACTGFGAAEQDEVCEPFECERGLGCVALFSTVGICRPYCLAADACAGVACLAVPDQAIGLCTLTCNPLEQTGCPPNQECTMVQGAVPDTGAPAVGLVCVPNGDTPPGLPCGVARCQPGAACVDGTCREFCDFSNPDCANCTGFDPALRVGVVEYGVCQ